MFAVTWEKYSLQVTGNHIPVGEALHYHNFGLAGFLTLCFPKFLLCTVTNILHRALVLWMPPLPAPSKWEKKSHLLSVVLFYWPGHPVTICRVTNERKRCSLQDGNRGTKQRTWTSLLKLWSNRAEHLHGVIVPVNTMTKERKKPQT